MTPKHISDATLRVRDYLYEGLLRREGEALTEDVARERANNLATGVIETLRQMAEEAKASDEPPPIRHAGKVARHLEDLPDEDWKDAPEVRAIRTGGER